MNNVGGSVCANVLFAMTKFIIDNPQQNIDSNVLKMYQDIALFIDFMLDINMQKLHPDKLLLVRRRKNRNFLHLYV